MTARLKRHLDGMRQRGALHAFNAEYRCRREQAQAEGEPFMSYATAMARLQQAIVAHYMAKRSASTAKLVVAVFEPGLALGRALVAQRPLPHHQHEQVHPAGRASAVNYPVERSESEQNSSASLRHRR